MVRPFWRVKQRSVVAISPHVWKLPLLVNLWLAVTAVALTTAVHKRTQYETSLAPFTAAVLVVLLCPLNLVWLKLAARYHKPSNATSQQSRPPPLDGGSRGPPKQKSLTVMVVRVCSSKKHSSPRCKVVRTVVCVLAILGVLFLLLLLSGDVERNPGPLDRPTRVTEDKVDELAALLSDEAANWYLFLGGLGVSDGIRDQIQLQSVGQPNMAQYCLTRGLHHWAKSAECPTYEKIIEVLNNCNKPLVKKVEEFASKHAMKPLPLVDHEEKFFDAVEIQLDECESFAQCRRYLQEYYKAQTTAPAEDTKWPPTPSKHYINLAYISKKNTTRQQAYAFTKSTIDGDIDDILRAKKPMNMRNIAKLQPDGSYHKLVLVEGAPGVGKTTFSWELCRRWAEGELLQHYSLVVVLRCRDKTVRKARTIGDLLFRRKHNMIDSVLQDMDTNLGRAVLIIIEGYDELPAQVRETKSIFSDLIRGYELSCATVLVTSRPSASGGLKYQQRLTQHIEILGFTKKQLQLYLKSVLTEASDLTKLEQSLKLRPQIHAAMYIPLNAAIVVLVYQESGELPATMTELYKSLTRSILIRYLRGSSEIDVTLEDIDNLPLETCKQFLQLCKLAYDGICNSQQLIFSKSDVPKDFETLGFVQSVTELYVSKGAVVSYNFLHLTIQEFLAAFHIFKQLPEKWTEHFEKYQKESRFKVVLRFLAGLTKLKPNIPVVNVDQFSQELKINAKVNLNCLFYRSLPELDLDTVHWLFEAHDPTPVEMNDYVQFDLAQSMMPLDYYVLGYCLRSYANWNVYVSTFISTDISEEDLELLALGYNAGSAKASGEGVTLSLIGIDRCTFRSSFLLNIIKALEIDILNADMLQLLSARNLEVLKIGKITVGVNAVLEIVSTSHTLKYLDLSDHPNLLSLPSRLTRFASILRQHQPPLTRLGLRKCGINRETMGSLNVSLSKITHIDLSRNPICNKGAIALAGKIAQGSLHLTELDLSCCGIGRSGVAKLTQALARAKRQTISVLNLSSNQFGDSAATGLARLLEHSSSTLTVLALNSCSISPEGGAQIAQALCTNITLKVLNVSRNKLNMDILATLLQHNSGLTHLEVCYCNIVIPDKEQLLKLVCSNTNSQLVVLNVSDNTVTSVVSGDVFQLYKPKALKQLHIGKSYNISM